MAKKQSTITPTSASQEKTKTTKKQDRDVRAFGELVKELIFTVWSSMHTGDRTDQIALARLLGDALDKYNAGRKEIVQ